MAAESENVIIPRKEKETEEKSKKERFPIYVRPGILSVHLFVVAKVIL